jgi:hypothetical protein
MEEEDGAAEGAGGSGVWRGRGGGAAAGGGGAGASAAEEEACCELVVTHALTHPACRVGAAEVEELEANFESYQHIRDFGSSHASL